MPGRVRDLRVSAVFPASGWSHLGELYWRVRVFPTKKAMYAYYRRIANPIDRAYGKSAGWESICDFEGITCGRETISYAAGEVRGQLRRKLGEVLLWRGALGSRVLSHEAFHMATCTLRAVGRQKRRNLLRLRQDAIDDAEELIAYTLCHIFGELVSQLYDAKLARAVA